MYTVITDGNEIKQCQEKFESLLTAVMKEKIQCRPAFPGDRVECDAHWSDELKIWVAFRISRERYWNAFGFEKPKVNSRIAISAEINIPCDGLNRRRVNGIFVKNEEGKIAVVHRGNFGGNHPIRSSDFLSKTSSPVVEVEDCRGITKAALVGEFDSTNFTTQVRDFIKEVCVMKGTYKESVER